MKRGSNVRYVVYRTKKLGSEPQVVENEGMIGRTDPGGKKGEGHEGFINRTTTLRRFFQVRNFKTSEKERVPSSFYY